MTLDLFTPLKPAEQLHPQFEMLRTNFAYSPARRVINDLLKDFNDPDGNFLEQFQTNGFDSRTFELYLFAVFKEQGFAINRNFDRPDFILENGGQRVCVEAVTATSGGGGTPKPYNPFPEFKAPAEAEHYLLNEVAMRFGSPLFSKLSKKYWQLPQCADTPLVFGIESFHDAGSLGISASTLARYLFGLQTNWYFDDEDNLVIVPQSVTEHVDGLKKIPSGFFSQPGGEHVSAVLFSNSGTVAKFNRMGQQGVHHEPDVRMFRYGTCYRWDSNSTLPAPFVYEVGDHEAIESWRQGTVLIKNPNAIHPLHDDWFGASVEEDLVDGKIVSTFAQGEAFHPFMSITPMVASSTPNAVVEAHINMMTAPLFTLYPT